MSATVKVRKLPDGRIQARRLDGAPMTAEDRQEAKRLAGVDTAKAEAIDKQAETPLRAWVIQEIFDMETGKLRAVKLCSAPLETHLWVLYDLDYIPPDDDPIFFADELKFLINTSIESLREVLKVKIPFPRARVLQ